MFVRTWKNDCIAHECAKDPVTKVVVLIDDNATVIEYEGGVVIELRGREGPQAEIHVTQEEFDQLFRALNEYSCNMKPIVPIVPVVAFEVRKP